MAKRTSLNDIKFRKITAVIRRWVDENGISKETSEVCGEALSLLITSDLDKRYKECLASLNPVEAGTRVENVEDAYKDTLEWIFNPGFGFYDWLQGRYLNIRSEIKASPARVNRLL